MLANGVDWLSNVPPGTVAAGSAANISGGMHHVLLGTPCRHRKVVLFGNVFCSGHFWQFIEASGPFRQKIPCCEG
jgi:hypothetical protein